MLLKAGILQPGHVMLPCAGRLMAVAVSLPELWRTRQPLQEVEGLDLALSNRLLGASSPKQSRHVHHAVTDVCGFKMCARAPPPRSARCASDRMLPRDDCMLPHQTVACYALVCALMLLETEDDNQRNIYLLPVFSGVFPHCGSRSVPTKRIGQMPGSTCYSLWATMVATW